MFSLSSELKGLPARDGEATGGGAIRLGWLRTRPATTAGPGCPSEGRIIWPALIVLASPPPGVWGCWGTLPLLLFWIIPGGRPGWLLVGAPLWFGIGLEMLFPFGAPLDTAAGPRGRGKTTSSGRVSVSAMLKSASSKSEYC
jgi:hypothetical protein